MFLTLHTAHAQVHSENKRVHASCVWVRSTAAAAAGARDHLARSTTAAPFVVAP